MRINFIGDIERFNKGIDVLSKEYGYEISEDGIPVYVNSISGAIKAELKGGCGLIEYDQTVHFYRALGLFLEKAGKEDEFIICEEPQFTTVGVMFDLSQGNAVIALDNLKKMIIRMSVMGLNTLMLYMEDSYEVDEEPFFGYMRSKYTVDEIKEIDNFADCMGIEIIPCIQTLAHLIDVLKWSRYRDYTDNVDTLMVGDERTYELVEKMILAIKKAFRSDRIHIGLDEAWDLGSGRYLIKNGYRDKFEIMCEHTAKVVGIVKKHGLKPMMWGDMYFISKSKQKDYYDDEVIITDEMAASVPKDVQLVYWDYYNNEESFYCQMIKAHKKLNPDVIFAGGIWSWTGYGVGYDKTFKTTNSALSACKSQGVKEVFATIWGDDGTECPVQANLLGMQLFAEHAYTSQFDVNKLKNRFNFCTKACYEDFLGIKLLDEVYGLLPQELMYINPSKYIMWQDILAGLFDKNLEKLDLNGYYSHLVETMVQAASRNGEYSFLFEFYSKVCSILAIKANIGNRIREVYKKHMTEALEEFVCVELPELYSKVNELKIFHRDIWMVTYKPLGWEIMDLRYGALLARIDTAIYRIKNYLCGRIDKIEELEEERFSYENSLGFAYNIPDINGLVCCNFYARIFSASRISMDVRYF